MARIRTALIALTMASTSILGASVAFSGVVSPVQISQVPSRHLQPLKIVAFGSSSTQGLGASSPAASYPAQLQLVLNRLVPQDQSITVVNRGIAGEDADDMIKRLKKDVIDRHPDLVIFQTGSNDPMRHVPLERFERETRATVAAMQSAGIAVILMEPQWCPTLDKIAAAIDYRDVVRKVGTEMNVDVIRRSDLMHDWIAKGVLTKREMLASDGLHMRDQGYALLAKWVAADIMKTGALKTLSQPIAPQQAKI